MKRLIALAALGAALAPTAAYADDGTSSGPDVSFTLLGSTNYEWRGVSQSDNDPSLFAIVNVGYKGFYAGGRTENVDFAGIDQEYDLWGGYTLPLGHGVKLDVGFVRYGYVDAPVNIDTFEVKGALSGSVGKLGLTGSAYHTWDYFGSSLNATYYEASASYPVADKFTLSGAFGHQAVHTAFNYNTWNAGVSYAPFKGGNIDLRYWDTDDDGFLFGSHGKARIVGSFSLTI